MFFGSFQHARPLHHGYSGFSCDYSVFVKEGEVMSIYYANFPDNIVLCT